MRNVFQHPWFIAYAAIVTKEVTRFMRIWMQTMLPPVISMSLYFVIFGNLIGSRIGSMSGYNYIDYIAPGIIMMSVMNNAYANVVSSFFSSKFQRFIEELIVSPVPNLIILAGYVTGGVARGLLTGVLVTIVAMFFTDLKIHDFFIAISVIFLTSTLFSLAGLINGIFAKKFDDVSVIPTFVLTPLIYLGGVFYTISLLPEFWQNVSSVNPILYMVNAFRYGFIGVSDINIAYAFIIIVFFNVLLFLLCWYLLHKGTGIKT